MTIKKVASGEYQTNTYVLKFNGFEFVIDPSFALDFVLENTENLKAILITHGHFDHIWQANMLREKTNAKIYCPIQDNFMLESDCFNLGLTPFVADFYIDNNKGVKRLNIEGVDVRFYHFPGHTPGCSVIEINGHFFSGDFVFKRSVGRCDFPYSNPQDMKDSLTRFMNIESNLPIHPGHGEDTDVYTEKGNIPTWIRYIG